MTHGELEYPIVEIRKPREPQDVPPSVDWLLVRLFKLVLIPVTWVGLLCKRFYVLALLLALCGCDQVAYRQKLVESFGTAEVSEVGSGQFVIRDTNGAIWYHVAGSSTKLFDAPR